MSSEEIAARYIYIGTTILHRTEAETKHMRFGDLLDQWEIHRQMNGMAKRKRQYTIDDVFPDYLV